MRIKRIIEEDEYEKFHDFLASVLTKQYSDDGKF